MKLVIQRVKRASVSIDGQVYSQIQEGLLLLVGVGPDDDQKDLEYAVRKVTQMRIFSDEDGKMNLSVKDIQGEILSISQFTSLPRQKKAIVQPLLGQPIQRWPASSTMTSMICWKRKSLSNEGSSLQIWQSNSLMMAQ